jgi:hypothetical protein
MGDEKHLASWMGDEKHLASWMGDEKHLASWMGDKKTKRPSAGALSLIWKRELATDC